MRWSNNYSGDGGHGNKKRLYSLYISILYIKHMLQTLFQSLKHL